MIRGIPDLDKCLRANKNKEKDGKQIISNKFELAVGLYGAMMVMENRRGIVSKNLEVLSPCEQAVEIFESGSATAEELEEFKLCGASIKNLEKAMEKWKFEELKEEVDTYCYSYNDDDDVQDDKIEPWDSSGKNLENE